MKRVTENHHLDGVAVDVNQQVITGITQEVGVEAEAGVIDVTRVEVKALKAAGVQEDRIHPLLVGNKVLLNILYFL